MHTICILHSSKHSLHVSGAICIHPQEHKLQITAIGVCNGYGVLIHWSRYWLGHPHTFSTVKFVLLRMGQIAAETFRAKYRGIKNT
jgi:hypothetical protein